MYIQINEKAPVEQQIKQLKSQLEIILDNLDLVQVSTGDSLPEGGTDGQVLTKQSDGSADWEDSTGGAAENGLPAGGTSDQMLVKNSNDNYDSKWVNPYTHPVNHSPAIISQDADNRFVSDTEKATWNGKADADHDHVIEDVTGLQDELDDVGVPTGGTAGQVLVKQSETDRDAAWETMESGGGGVEVVTALPASPTDGQTVILMTASQKYLATYQASDSKWFKTALYSPGWGTVYLPDVLYSLFIGDAPRSIVAINLSIDFQSAFRMKGATSATKLLIWSFTSAAGPLHIWCGCETENPTYDWFKIYLDNVQIGSTMGGTILSRYITTTLTAGTHTLKLEYRKDSGGDSGYDGGQIYAIVLP